MWTIKNPNVNVPPHHLPHDVILKYAKPYLGPSIPNQ